MPNKNTLALGINRALYTGELPVTGWHRHASPVLLLGLSGRFAVQLRQRHIETCYSALIDSGVDHVFDPCGEHVALMYLEPDSIEARRLRVHFSASNGVIFDPAVRAGSRSRMDAYLRAFDVPSLLQFSCAEAPSIDDRVARSLLALRALREGPLSRTHVAADVLLSASRFNHLFRSEMGVSFRSYRVWTQVRSAMAGLCSSPRLTEAALQGGFVDSSHFSRMFRQTFGMTPSSVLKPLKEIALV
jgi:AraC-like DNA-binding protein